jgi:uncharacterized protein (TIGR00730 family)
MNRRSSPIDTTDRQIDPAIAALIESSGIVPGSFRGRIIAQLIQDSLKLADETYDGGQLKLISRAMREMRYAYRVFNRYVGTRKISIFGSARTPPEHPDYIAAREFSRSMAAHGWMCITGAGDGIMKAGHEGPQREASFGLSIRLPFETTANTVIEGDPKLINFRYFFTRKLMFMSHADAVAVFPGGFGTQDELFEALTLVQTGKSNPVPIVMIEGKGGVYWQHWASYIRDNLLGNGWISPEDPNIFHIARDIDDAVDHVVRFYSVYHSSRYVGDQYVLRLTRALSPQTIEQLNDTFAPLYRDGGRIAPSGPLPGEEDHLTLPRLVFKHTRRQFGLIRALIDRVNALGAEDIPAAHVSPMPAQLGGRAPAG